MTSLVASDDGRRSTPPITALDRRPGVARLPFPLTTMIGRDDDLAAAVDMLRRESVRLITVTGPAGVGKTRFAVSAAAAGRDRFVDGVAWVPLAAVSDPDAVTSAVCRAVGVVENGRVSPPEALRSALRDARLLLLLDNFEHLLPATPSLAELLVGCPHVAALVTSRARLHVSGERVFPLPPLDVPTPDARAPIAGVAAAPSVQLFVTRAQSIVSGFALTDATAPLVGDICRRLDGLPLAIELAAGRIGHMEVATLAARLERRLPLLTAGARDLPARHRTLRDAIAWSYDLLSPLEQDVLRRTSVFADGFTLDAVEAIALAGQAPGDGGVGPDPAGGTGGALALDVVGSLVDKSLVRHLPDALGGPRYALLETIREYGAERLSASGEEAATRTRHAGWFLAFAESHEVFFNGPHREPHLTLLAAEWPNLQVAFGWFDALGLTVERLRLAIALYQFSYLSGRSVAVGAWLEGALSGAGEVPTLLRGRALTGLAYLRQYHGGEVSAAADRYATDGLALVRPVATPAQLHVSLMTAGLVAAFRNDDGRAEALFQEALAVARTIPDPSESTTATADALDCLGDIAHGRGQLEAAIANEEQALALYRMVGDAWGEVVVLQSLGDLASEQGAHDRAVAWYRQCLLAERPEGETLTVAASVAGIAAAALAHGLGPAAARLAGVSEALLRRAGIAELRPKERRALERTAESGRALLGDDAYAAEWALGSTMSVDEAMAVALDLPLAAAPERRISLTRREAEILPRLAEGQTHRVIARELFISERTVNSHVSRLFAKLKVRSRAAAVQVGVDLGLLGRTSNES